MKIYERYRCGNSLNSFLVNQIILQGICGVHGCEYSCSGLMNCSIMQSARCSTNFARNTVSIFKINTMNCNSATIEQVSVALTLYARILEALGLNFSQVSRGFTEPF
jgi:hypothetical protein